MTVMVLVVYLHFLGVVTLFALLFAQILLFRPDLTQSGQQQLVALDLAYGAAATLVLITGLARVFAGGPGPGHYFGMLAFHFMGAAFLAAALLSLYPTRIFLVRRRALRAGRMEPLASATATRLVRIQYAELALLLLALWLAVVMARGHQVGLT
ncbi:MAG TPA: DUF2214 domain-containing protein [Gammaproteobacteria bacterium]|nr:DUF2214 domain-containing protein [Gammaproteobacteria bacterium]